MTDISLILLDLNGVLYRYDRAARIAHLASVTGQSAAAVEAAIWTSGFEDAGDTGALDAEAYLRGFGAYIGHHVTPADWLAAHAAAVTPIAETLALLSGIRAGLRLAVLTNNNLLVRRHFATLYGAAATLVGDAAYVSAEFGARKPDPAVYARCLGRLGVPAAHALFIDDSADNVAGAVAAGLQGLIFTDADALAADLRSRGLLA